MTAQPDIFETDPGTGFGAGFGAGEDFAEELAPGTTLLHGQYVIERYLVHGGFGITYLARDSLDRTVVIKECFPGAICCRSEGRVQARTRQMQDHFAAILRHFIREARRLSRLRHPSIVGVHQVFEERDTAYMALDYVEGRDLLAVLEEQPGRLTPELVISVLRRTLEAVGYVHEQGMLHRDISPDNILLDDAGHPTLVDFGAARDYATRENRALSALLTVKDGYSPQEFYLTDEPQRPASDLYSLGATFHHLIVGEAPPNSQQRLSSVATRGQDPYVPLVSRAPWYDRDFLAAIDRALELFPDDRFQSADEWLAAIAASRGRPAMPAEAAEPAASDGAAGTVTPAEPAASAGTAAPAPSAVAGQGAGGATAAVPHDTEILRAISAAIAEAGADRIEPRMPGRRRPAPAAEGEPASAAPRRFVDIFGNPIEDVEAWLEEQERELRRRGGGASPTDAMTGAAAGRGGGAAGRKAGEETEEKTGAAEAPATGARRSGLLGALLGR